MQQRKCGTLPVAVNGGLYREPYDGIQMRKLPEPPVPVICSTGELFGCLILYKKARFHALL